MKTYRITGQMFFGTMSRFADLFDYKGDPDRVVIDFGATHLWDPSAVTAIAKAIAKYEHNGKRVAGLNEESQALLDRTGLAVPTGH